MHSISQALENWYGIKADPADIRKLQIHLLNNYGKIDQGILKEIFLSGEAASFLTVNETYFFREPVHFNLLREYLSVFERSFIQIFSAACSSGCEAYSIAMLIEAYNKSSKNPIQYHIDACDINPKAIDTAKCGIYSQRVLREDGSCFHYLVEPFFLKNEDSYEIDSCLKKHVSFFVHNLMNKLPLKEYDIVFFRNALIYFFPEKREIILSNLTSSLREGGILIAGVSETAGIYHVDLEQIFSNDAFYYRKKRSAVNFSLQG